MPFCNGSPHSVLFGEKRRFRVGRSIRSRTRLPRCLRCLKPSSIVAPLSAIAASRSHRSHNRRIVSRLNCSAPKRARQGRGAPLLRMPAASLLRRQKAGLQAIEEPSLPMPLSMLRAGALLPFTNRAFSQASSVFHASLFWDRLLPRQSYFLVLMVFVRVFV